MVLGKLLEPQIEAPCPVPEGIVYGTRAPCQINLLKFERRYFYFRPEAGQP